MMLEFKRLLTFFLIVVPGAVISILGFMIGAFFMMFMLGFRAGENVMDVYGDPESEEVEA